MGLCMFVIMIVCNYMQFYVSILLKNVSFHNMTITLNDTNKRGNISNNSFTLLL